MVGPLREVLRVMHGGPFEGSFLRVMHDTDGRQFTLKYIYLEISSGANAPPPVGAHVSELS